MTRALHGPRRASKVVALYGPAEDQRAFRRVGGVPNHVTFCATDKVGVPLAAARSGMLTVVERPGAVSTERGRERWPETTLVEITRSRALTMKLLKQPAKHEEGRIQSNNFRVKTWVLVSESMQAAGLPAWVS